MVERPYSPETLAARWECSPEKIRQMCRKDELPHFRLGKLIRIPAVEVEYFECRTRSTGLPNIEESGRSPMDRALPFDEFRLARMI